jgi:glycine/D-amino acid oxidase-like deaminating enzyme
MRDYRRYSFWLDTVPDDLTPRPALTSDIDADVAIVGAGYTGLWTAYYLVKADPGLRIAVIEAEIAGFGASGRNGGWASALFSADSDKLERRFGRPAVIRFQQALFATVDEIGRVAMEEGLDIHFTKGGSLALATNPAHLQALKSELSHHWARGFSEADFRWLDAAAASQRVDVGEALGAAYTPHCAALHPARLARGLARVVEALGVQIFERTPVTSIEPRAVRAPGGRIKADVVVRATEAYTRGLPGLRRSVLPIYSLMIATEPLPQSFWDGVGWGGRETLTDGRHLLIYAQRTADDRIAMGGRGAPYHYASRIADAFDRDPAVFGDLRRVLATLFPALGDAAVTHQWGGPIGVARDWISSVGLDRGSGLAWAGGYAGDGVSTTNLAGRTLRDLILERATELVALPWVNHRSRAWEPEPLRWLGARLAQTAVASADRVERRTGRPARRTRLVTRLIGREI